jgi:hypothetical protein
MYLLFAIIIGAIATFFYYLGLKDQPEDVLNLADSVSAFLFVSFSFIAIVLVFMSAEKDGFWPWHWRMRRKARNHFESTRDQRSGYDRRVGADRRVTVGTAPEGQDRRARRDRRTFSGVDRREIMFGS